MEQQELIMTKIIVQLFGTAGANFFSLLVTNLGGKNAQWTSLFRMVALVGWLTLTHFRLELCVSGGLAGFDITGVQSVRRCTVDLLNPPEKSADFYGFFTVTGHTSSVIGPTVFGLLTAEAPE